MRRTLKPVGGIVALLTMSGIACGPEPGAPGDLEQSSSALTLGNWSEILQNGSAGPDPFPAPHSITMFFCEKLVIDDRRFHAGKLYNGTCRWEWGDNAAWSHSYRVLQKPASGSYSLVWNPGFTPNNAVSTHPTDANPGLPVCVYAGHPGKVWNGTCRIEYAEDASSSTGFHFVVHNP